VALRQIPPPEFDLDRWGAPRARLKPDFYWKRATTTVASKSKTLEEDENNKKEQS
jgi:hypothetical protein